MPSKHAMFLALGHRGAHAGAREEARNARTARAHAFGQRALRAEFDFQFSRQELPFEFPVLAHVAGDHFANLPRLQQQAQRPSIHAGVVACHGQILLAGVAQRDDQRFGNAAQAEPAHGDRHAVFDDAVQCSLRTRINLGNGQAV